jgi:hypothetical protein
VISDLKDISTQTKLVGENAERNMSMNALIHNAKDCAAFRPLAHRADRPAVSRLVKCGVISSGRFSGLSITVELIRKAVANGLQISVV